MEIDQNDHCDYLNAMTITKLCLGHSFDRAVTYCHDYKANYTDFDPYILYACTHNNYQGIQAVLNKGVGYLYILCYKIACYHGHLKIMDLLMNWVMDSGNMSDFSPHLGIFSSQMIDNNPQTLELIITQMSQTQHPLDLVEEFVEILTPLHLHDRVMTPIMESMDLLSCDYERAYRDASRWMLQICYFLLEGGHLNQIDLTTEEIKQQIRYMNRLRKNIRQPLPHVLERFLEVPHFDDLLMIFIDLFNQYHAYGLNVDLINLYLDWLGNISPCASPSGLFGRSPSIPPRSETPTIPDL